ncbi:unnamed protein product [Bursaphelenchus xylophilus]|uniref:(pine wood nematode) hypothetical protein n=1 Tax=Bursaphelenchus xylophilus TaxID=6326 RepID=A0A811L1S3_BURXY|nr:unnamed protein product [Bursaphelenchus xylophilus]CAG9108551.1 unnamed protein product [Bursaphelenchus xylophilus]
MENKIERETIHDDSINTINRLEGMEADEKSEPRRRIDVDSGYPGRAVRSTRGRIRRGDDQNNKSSCGNYIVNNHN